MGENEKSAPTGFRDFRLHRRARITICVVSIVFVPLGLWLLTSAADPSPRLWFACVALVLLPPMGLVVDAIQRRRHGEPPQA